MSRAYLSDKNILVVSKPLAKALGVAMSIVLRRVQHWLEYNEHEGKEQSHFHDGRWWAYNGYQKWTDDIEIYSKSTIKRLFTDLEKLGLLISTNEYNKRKGDQTKWYSINYEAYDAFISMWQECGCPLHKDGKKPKEYQSFIDQWTTVGIPTVVPPVDHSDTTNGLQWVQQETTVVPPLPESPTEGTTDKSVESESAEVIKFPDNIKAFEEQAKTTHPWIGIYKKSLKQGYYRPSSTELDLIPEIEKIYTQEQFEYAVNEKLKEKPGAKLLWVLQDMPNLIAAKTANGADGYHTMSPAVPAPEGHRKATPEETDAIIKAALEGKESA